MRIILGSSSQWRRTLWIEHFSRSSTSFLSPDIDEKAIRHSSAEALTLLIANAKADALAAQLLSEDPATDALLVCMDQVVRCQGEIREKPISAAQARDFLATYSSGAPAECVNAVVVHNLQSGARCGANEVASVLFRRIPESVVEAAIEQGDIFTSAGAFAIDSPLFQPWVGEIHGTREAVIGLPLHSLRTLLARASPDKPATGITAPSPMAAASPSAMVPGLLVRPLQPADESIVRSLFAEGMGQTIASGVRAELLRPDAVRGGAALGVLAAALAVLHLWLGLAPSTALAAVGSAAALVTILMVRLLPGLVASGYVRSSLAADMCTPYAHYMGAGRRGSCFWVAVDDASSEVVGMVAVEPCTGIADGAGWQWRVGDAELRRMSVATWARGHGVARALFAELRRFAEQCPEYERIVLSTSTLQGVAHDHLYPNLGFVPQHQHRLLGEVVATYFALQLACASD